YLQGLVNNWLFETETIAKGISNVIALELIEGAESELDWHSIAVDDQSILIKAHTKSGIAKGIQTLRQLMPAESFSDHRKEWNIKSVQIEDFADFEHRGMLLDCCRHYFEKDVVFKYIDLLALYKMNVLHWHLTEDQGWRVEIDSYPMLNTIASSRTELDGSVYSGIYSKEDMKAVVAYAKERGITVIPEIELPGHSQAAIAAYPHLSCTGEQVPVANDWGVFKEIYCAGNDSTFVFLEAVLDEVMEIFPSTYIHIGGDEAPKTRWEQCEKCQKRIKEEHLHSEHELQSYFINRIEKYLNKNNRQLIGWDEILEGGLSPGATVQSWRGFDGGMAAARSKHNVIMSPTSHCYFDYDLKSTDMKEVFYFQPIPDDLEPEFHQYIL
ncbi:MAG: beta-N-acetylhexosaminidase, partial [Flavobacteriales bacterium]